MQDPMAKLDALERLAELGGGEDRLRKQHEAGKLTALGVNLPLGQQSEITAKPQTWDQILLHVAPESVIKAMADGDVLQIVVFSILFAVALGMIGEKGRPVVVWCEAVAETMFKFTNIVIHYAPIGVGAAIAYTVGHGGLRVLVNLAWLVATLPPPHSCRCPFGPRGCVRRPRRSPAAVAGPPAPHRVP